jgi:hypothetical protein
VSAHPGGRPDERFPAQPAVVAPAVGGEVLVSVVANVNLTSGEGRIRFVNPLPDGRASGIEERGDVTLRAVADGGQVLREYPVRVNLSSELGPDDDREGLVDAKVAVPAETRAIELTVGGRVADSVRVGGPPPALRAVRRLPDAGGQGVRVALEPEALEEGHTFAVQVSVDGGRTWRTVAVGLTDPAFEIDRSRFRPGQEVQVRVLATNGLATAVVTTETLRIE